MSVYRFCTLSNLQWFVPERTDFANYCIFNIMHTYLYTEFLQQVHINQMACMKYAGT